MYIILYLKALSFRHFSGHFKCYFFDKLPNPTLNSACVHCGYIPKKTFLCGDNGTIFAKNENVTFEKIELPGRKFGQNF